MLDRFFKPESIAVVGATPKEGKVGNTLLNNIIVFRDRTKVKSAKEVSIYAVNPHYEKILGIACYPSVLQIADGIDPLW